MSDLDKAIAIADAWRHPARWKTLAFAVREWRDAKNQRDQHLQICGRDQHTAMFHQAVEQCRKAILALHDEFYIIQDYIRQHYLTDLITKIPAIDWLEYEPGREEEHAQHMSAVFSGLLAHKAKVTAQSHTTDSNVAKNDPRQPTRPTHSDTNRITNARPARNEPPGGNGQPTPDAAIAAKPGPGTNGKTPATRRTPTPDPGEGRRPGEEW